MEMLEKLDDLLKAFTADPKTFIIVAIFFLLLGVAAGKWITKSRGTAKDRLELAASRLDAKQEELAQARERIKVLEAEAASLRLQVKDPPPPPPFPVLYPERGRQGQNILNEDCTQIFVDRRYSMLANVPVGSELQVFLVRPSQNDPFDLRPPWSTVHRSSTGWREIDGGEQEFTWRLSASGEQADIQISPKIVGTYGVHLTLNGIATVRDLQVVPPTA